MGCAGSVGCTGRFPISLLTLSDRIIVIGASYVPGTIQSTFHLSAHLLFRISL